MKKNKYLPYLHDDIVSVFAHLYMQGDKSKAKKVLDRQTEIT